MTRSSSKLIKLLFAPTFAIITISAASLNAAPTPAANDKTATIDFNRDIRPILSDNCFLCHGPDKKHRKAKLRLDLKDEALADRDGAPAIKPGSLKDSELWHLINSDDKDEIMPPVKSNKSLNAEQKALIKKWIEQGAQWNSHWAFNAPAKPNSPSVKNKTWAKVPIDQFILAEIEKQGLAPSPEASRETLIRRVSYDLTGLPPTLSELDKLLADTTAAWYEKVVDHYLSKKAFGERMALAWMDASRYGDTSVFHADGPRDMWPWRDWIINAYNSNMPFDQFTVEQIAGDLIPNATVNQKIASGFNRNHATTDEGGAIAEEWRIDYVVDRVSTTSKVWLGMSMECAQCHDHKYDPVTQKEYYGFFAFFNQTSDPGMQSRRGNQTPTVNVPNLANASKIAEIQKQIAAIDGKIKAHEKTVEPAFQKWVIAEAAKVKGNAKPQAPSDMLAHFPLDDAKGNKAIDAVNSKHTGIVRGATKWENGKFGGAFRVDRKNYIEYGNTGDFDNTDSFSFGCWVKPDDVRSGVPIGKMNEGNKFRGYDLILSNGQVAMHLINAYPENALKVITNAKIPNKKWTHIFATYDGTGIAEGVKIYFNGKAQPWRIELNSLKGTTKTKVALKVGRRHTTSPYLGLIDDVRLYKRQLSGREVAALAGGDPIAPLLAIEAKSRTAKQTQTLRTHYTSSIDTVATKLNQEKGKFNGQIAALNKTKITSMIMGEQAKPRPTYLLMRGHYASPDKSEVIKPEVPSFLPRLPKGAPNNRLGLAKWMVADNHPLTARVTVNRYWTMIFGRGIVSTAVDFGSQGAWPSHPQLLDWLAVDFRENGWDIKRTLKQMLMSATYRQSSRTTTQLGQVDPENLLLARGPRFRMQGDFIRDTALAVSGLLVDEVGGRGVKPYQPPGLWNAVSLNGGLRFKKDAGEKLYRKSMYIYWRRSAPHPGMTIFDAPTREKCVIQRSRTNTPLQALYTMNGIQFVEAARTLAQRMMKEGGNTPAGRIRFAYRMITSHKPSPAAMATLINLYQTELAAFKKDEAAAKELLGVGDSKRDETLDLVEHATWTAVANVLLNMDSALTKF